jgi:FdhD protein
LSRIYRRAPGRPDANASWADPPRGLLGYHLDVEPTEKVRVLRRDGASGSERDDLLAVEEPLEIRLRPDAGTRPESFVVTMRTPGQDEDLAAGLLFAEGVVRSPREIVALDRPDDPRLDSRLRGNVLVATLAAEACQRASHLRRHTVMGSACGVCGRTAIDRVLPVGAPALPYGSTVAAEVLYELPDRLRDRQSIFSKTGGLHAAALFDAAGCLLAMAEDIGRHNATDKLVGAALRQDRLPLSDSILLVSGRAGFEIVQKAYGAGIPVLAAVSAPSSLAAELAEAAGMTLVGFLRGRRFNLYTHPRRIGA